MRADCRRYLLPAIEALCFAALLALALSFGFGRPAYESLVYHPAPDTAEQMYVATALAEGRDPRIPVGAELHPSRYSPVHPALLSVGLRLVGRQHVALYSPLAILLGCGLWWLWLVLGGVPRALRVGLVAMLLFSQMVLHASGRLMQEPSMWLLFTCGQLLWLLALRRAAGPKSMGQALVATVMAGALTGGLVAIRPTHAPLPLLMLALLALAGARTWVPWRRVPPLVVALAVGGCGIAGLVLVMVHRLSGLWELTGYTYWDGQLMRNVFGLKYGRGVPPNAPLELPLWLLNLQTIGGWRDWLTPLPPLLLVLVYTGLPVGIARAMWGSRRGSTVTAGAAAANLPLFRAHALILGLYGASQVAIHSIYNYYDARFFFLAFPALLAAGVVGWHGLVGGRPSARVRWWAWGVAALALAIGLLPAQRRGYLAELATCTAWNADEATAGVARLRQHQAAGRLVRARPLPVFVSGFGLLNARMFMGLEALPWPVAPAEPRRSEVWDAHMNPDFVGQLPPPRARLAGASAWTKRPWEQPLVGEGGVVEWPLIEGLMREAGGVYVYYPYWRIGALQPLIAGAEARGWRREVLMEGELMLVRLSLR